MGRPPRPARPEVYFQDGDILLVDKPPRVQVRRDASGRPCLRELIPQPVDWPRALVWPLETDASGLVLYVRAPEHRRALRAEFEQREAEYVQLALVGGYVAQDGQVDSPLKFDSNAQRARVNPRSGKPALTEYKILERVAGNTLLECRPWGQRPHQVRAHLAGAGYPLTVDTTYGGGGDVVLSHYKSNYRPSKRREERPLLDRLSLHALRVAFTHPATGQRLTFEAPPPKDFRATVSQLRRLV